MTDTPTPDPFDDELGPRLHAAAGEVDGHGVSRASIAGAVDRNRRRQARTRSLVVGTAAVIAVLGGIAIATQTGGNGGEQVSSGPPSTTRVDPCGTTSTLDPALPSDFWLRLSDAQADALLAAGVITEAQAAGPYRHAIRLSYADITEVLNSPPVGPIGAQLFQMGGMDPAALEFLRAQHQLTDAQETTIADGVVPALTQDQADQLFRQFPDLTAFPAGGGPLVYPPASATTAVSGSAVVATTAPAAVSGTPFDEWAAVLRDKGLLTAEQEADIAAGKGFSLTSEQSAALQEYWDQQAAGTTTTALAFAPGQSTVAPPAPCAAPTTTIVTTTNPPEVATTTTEAATTTSVSILAGGASTATTEPAAATTTTTEPAAATTTSTVGSSTPDIVSGPASTAPTTTP